MSYIGFRTNTLLDMRAITMFGMHAKPNSVSPIGYFGTGLKMAIATLVRNNIIVRIFIGPREYTFRTKSTTFRNKEFQSIEIHRRRALAALWDVDTLPFTMELAKNWELWMAFRELEANTRDEGGETFFQLQGGGNWDTKEDAKPGTTLIAVENSPAFEELYLKERDTIFLPNGDRGPTTEFRDLQILQKPSNYIYYRGMRVMELKKPSMLTYNVLQQSQLTEDRTLKDQWYLKYQIAAWIASLHDKAQINHFLNATDANWESDLDWDTVTPDGVSDEFKEAVTLRQKKQTPRPATLDSTPGYYPIWSSNRMTTLGKKLSRSAGDTLATRFKNWWADRISIPEDIELMREVQKVLDDQQAHEDI